MVTVYLSLGSNLGDREANLQEAMDRLRGMVTIEEVSSLYETAPIGYENQPDFLNAVCRGATDLEPQELLDFVKQIERDIGRPSSGGTAPRWGPRIIDIDILFYDEAIVSTPDLTIPHPRLHERAFVLVPLAEIAPQFHHPVLSATVQKLLDSLKDRQNVRKRNSN